MGDEWIRLDCPSAFVHWTSRLHNELFGVWVKLLLVVKMAGRGGVASRGTVLEWLDKTKTTETDMVAIVAASGGEVIDDGQSIIIRHWKTYQRDRTNADRQKHWRENHA
jgi:hypothetical protein